MSIYNEPVPIITKTNIESFPLEILPKWINEYVSAVAEELNTSVDLVVNASMSALSTTLYNKILLEVGENWKLNVNLYILALSPPGTKKDAVIDYCFNILHEIRKEEYSEHLKKKNKFKSEIDILIQKYEKYKME